MLWTVTCLTRLGFFWRESYEFWFGNKWRLLSESLCKVHLERLALCHVTLLIKIVLRIFWGFSGSTVEASKTDVLIQWYLWSKLLPLVAFLLLPPPIRTLPRAPKCHKKSTRLAALSNSSISICKLLFWLDQQQNKYVNKQNTADSVSENS